MPGFESGNQAKSEFGNIDDGLPDTAGENTISVKQLINPP